MQDNWQEFDRQFKSVLQDAREKAPRRVWRAVSGRLDSAVAPVIWWKWAVPALAFAALALGLVFSGTFDRRSADPAGDIIAQSVTVLPSDNVGSADADTDSETITEESVAEVPVSSPARQAAHVSQPGVSGRLLADNTALAPVCDPDLAESTAAEGDQDVNIPAEGSNETVATPDSGRQVIDNQDDTAAQELASQWADIEREDIAEISRGVFDALYARGSLSGNDSNLSYGGTGISRMAPGPGSADAGISESGSSTYGVPFTLGLGVRFRLSDKLSLGSGLDYSYLSRSFQGTYSDNYTGGIYHSVHYVGVPVNLYYNLLETGDGLFNVYAWGGGSAEMCVGNSFRLQSAPNTLINDKAGSFLFSAALGVGMEFKLTDALSLYLDPAVRYYFPGDGTQPKSVRTDKPFMFNFDAGLRFNL